MKKLLKWGGIILLIIIVIAALSGSGDSEEKTDDTTTTTSQTSVQEVKEATKITASELADAFDENQVAAESKWKDQFVEFSAEITNITDTGLSFGSVASEDFSMTQISCKIKDKNQLMSLKNGQTVIVRGVVGTQMMGVIDLKECVVVE